jgi:membrane protease YdiL (CAAX protease family)
MASCGRRWRSLIIFIAVFAVMNTVSLRAYYALHFSTAEVNASTIILCDLGAAGVGHLLIRLLRGRESGDFWRSIGWHYSSGGAVVALLGGLGATLLMRYALTGHLTIGLNPALRINALFLLVVLGTVVVEPLIEEIYFRGILFTGLATRIGTWVSICIVTLAFILLHVQHRWIVLPISIVLGCVRLYTKSTASCFALHVGYNLGVLLWGIR